MEIGTRVLRGPDWSGGNIDGGEGHLGTVVSLGGDTTCEILWDNGKRSICRIGTRGKHDLRVFDSGPTGLQHTGISCSECDVTNIAGTCWTCSTCETCNLCTRCYGDMKHDITHKFQRLDTPSSKGHEVPPRCSGLRIQATGLFLNAVVTKGADWCQEEFEGRANIKGKIVSVEDHPSGASVRSMVRVEWEDGQSGLYRAGHEGKVDVQYITEYPGTFYFRDHISVLRRGFETSTPVAATRPRMFTDGNRVCIKVSKSKLMEMQSREGIWNSNLNTVLEKFGTVKNYTTAGHVAVSYGGQAMEICEDALKKVPLLTEGDTVRISTDLEEVKQLQEYHGHFVDDMKKTLGKVGVVKKVGKSGHVMVGFGTVAWQFNPACCIPAPGQTVDVLHDTQRVRHPLTDLQEVFEARDELFFNVDNSTLDGEIVSDTGLLEKVEGMYDAFMKGNYDLCLMIMRLDPRLKKIVHHGTTLLTLACNNRRVDFTRQLLDEGVDINQPDAGTVTPIIHAMLRDNIDLAKLLVERGCDVNKPGQLQVTPLHMCAKLGMMDHARVLCGGNVDVNVKDMADNTPAHVAIESGHNDILSIILKSPSQLDPTILNGRHFAVLHTAAIVGNYSAIEMIVGKFPEVVDFVMPEHQFTPLHIAANNNRTDCVRALIDKGKASVNATNTEGWTPLHLACLKLHDNTVSCLLKKGANVNIQDKLGETPLHCTMGGASMSADTDVLGSFHPYHGQEEVRIKLSCQLIQGGANTDLRNFKGETPRDSARSEMIKTAVTMFIRSRSGPAPSTSQSSSSPQAEPSSQPTLTLPCSKCLTTIVDIKLRPCGHRYLCRQCVDVVKQCPFCKVTIDGVEDLNLEGNPNAGQNCKVQ